MFVAEDAGDTLGFCLIGPLPWETRVLGRRMAAVKYMVTRPEPGATNTTSALAAHAIVEAQRAGFEFLSCKMCTDDVSAVHGLQRAGFLLVDALLDFVITVPQPVAAPLVPADTIIRFANSDDRNALRVVAERAFDGHFGRFHADPRIGPARGRTIYQEWITSCLDGWADSIVVAEVDGVVAGYSAWKRPSETEARHGVALGHYSIGAVHPDFSGRGLFQAITHRGADSFMNLATHIEGPTHVSNHAVQHAYQRLGWRIADAHYTFHCWLTP